MSSSLKINPLIGNAIRKQFDKWYADERHRNQPNRMRLDQHTVLSSMSDSAGATALGVARDKRLQITRKKEGQGTDGTGS